MLEPIDLVALRETIEKAKEAARQYRRITGKPLGITGEVGEFVAADLLNLKLTEARQPGYDAIAADGRRIQIKTRCVLPGCKQSQKLGSIKLVHEWDTVILVLIDKDFEPLELFEAQRPDVEHELSKPGSKARNIRGSLSISKFKTIAKLLWWEKQDNRRGG